MLMSFCRHYLELLWLRVRVRMEGRQLIAIALVEHMGDIVAAEPVSRYARKRFEKALLVWIVQPAYRPLFEAFPSIDRVFTVNCLTEWILLRTTKIFDRQIDLHIRGRVCGTCQYPLAKEEGNAKINLANYYAFGNLLEVQCKSAGLPLLNDGPQLVIPSALAARIDKVGLPDRFVAIHCASNEETRDWVREKWNDLANLIFERLGLIVVEVGIKPVIDDSTMGYRSLCGQLTMLETAEVIRRATLFVGVDSGPAHFGNAFSVPGVILLGHYKTFAKYCPYSGPYGKTDHENLVQTPGRLVDLPVEAVFNAVEARLLRAHERSKNDTAEQKLNPKKEQEALEQELNH
jgi:ADP-heptose:LPS heptosyltransferase